MDEETPNTMPHIPVLLSEVLEYLKVHQGGIFVDGTFGAGGYSQAILAGHPDNRVLGIDRDPDAIHDGQACVKYAQGRLTLRQGRFSDLAAFAQEEFPYFDNGYVDGVVLDIGVSSMQIDKGERGFSFRQNGPLDMRMEQEGVSAAEIVNNASEEELSNIFHFYGEERRARAMARAIVEDRKEEAFITTKQLASLATRVIRTQPGIHSATRIFQALRIAVNQELEQLVSALYAAEQILRPDGRLVVVTFHSLEDRIVKQFFANRTGKNLTISRYLPVDGDHHKASFIELTKRPITAREEEMDRNPRARSAKLRAGQRTECAPLSMEPALSLLAVLPKTGRKNGRDR